MNTNTENTIVTHDHGGDDGPPYRATCTKCFDTIAAMMRGGHEVAVEAHAADGTPYGVTGRVVSVGKHAIVVERRNWSSVVPWERMLRLSRVGGA